MYQKILTPKKYSLCIIFLFFLLSGCKISSDKSQTTTLNDKLKSLVLEKTVMNLVPSNDSSQSQFISHFGGIPYFEKGEKWPINEETGKSLSFVFQLVNSDEIQLPKEIAVLQFYYDWQALPFVDEEEGWLVKTYSKLDIGNATALTLPDSVTNARYCTIHFSKQKSLPDWSGIEIVNRQLSRHFMNAEGEINTEKYDSATTGIIGAQEMHSYIGGYPMWVQYDETPENYKFMFQICSEDSANIMWGDVGTIYFFYNPRNPQDIEFLGQCY